MFPRITAFRRAQRAPELISSSSIDSFEHGPASGAVHPEPLIKQGLGGAHFRIRRMLQRQPVPLLAVRGEKPETDVLVVVAHPDDHTMYCGGLIARLTERGRSVAVVSASHGEGGRMLEKDKDGLLREVRSHSRGYVAGERDKESANVSNILGNSHDHLYSADANVDFGFLHSLRKTLTHWDETLDGGLDKYVWKLVREIRIRKPQVLLTTDKKDDPEGGKHGHHRGVHVLVDLAARLAADPKVEVDGLAPWAVEEFASFAPKGSKPDLDVKVDEKRRLDGLSAHGSQFFPEHLAGVGSRPTEGFMLVWRATGRRGQGWVLEGLLKNAVEPAKLAAE